MYGIVAWRWLPCRPLASHYLKFFDFSGICFRVGPAFSSHKDMAVPSHWLEVQLNVFHQYSQKKRLFSFQQVFQQLSLYQFSIFFFPLYTKSTISQMYTHIKTVKSLSKMPWEHHWRYFLKQIEPFQLRPRLDCHYRAVTLQITAIIIRCCSIESLTGE